MAMSMLIVDDHAEFRSFAGMMLASEGFDVAGEAGDGRTAVDMAERLHPDLLLVDVQMPGMDGFEVAQRLSALPHPPRVVLTSSRTASDYGARLTRSPALGFISKQDLSGAALSALIAA